jgi:hypothetical protein
VLPSSSVTNNAWSSVVGPARKPRGPTVEASLFSEPMPARRFPPAWSVEDIGAAFVVKDGAGQKLAYVYFEGGARPPIGRQLAQQG